MKKIKETLHRHHTNVPPSAAQATPYHDTTASTHPGTATEPILGGPSQASTGLATTSTSSTFAPTTIVQQERTIIEETTAVPTVVEQIPAAPFVTTAPALFEHREKAPVVQEVIRPGVREEIQPVVHREREQLEIREEIQPIYEKNVRPTVVEERQLAPEIRPEIRTGITPIIAEGPRSGVVVEQEHVESIMKAAIVEEVVHKKIIEEVQPVIHRETIAPRVIQEVQPIYEKVVEAPVVTYQTLPPVYAAGPTMTTTPVEQVVTTTTVVETEFIPENRGMGTSGWSSSGTNVLPTSTTAPTMSTTPSTMGSTSGFGTSGLGTSGLGAPMMSTPTSGLGTTTGLPPTTTTTTPGLSQQMNNLKLEEQRPLGQQPPSTFLNK